MNTLIRRATNYKSTKFSIKSFHSTSFNQKYISNADSNAFNIAIKSEKVVLVDFYATWCKPCDQLALVLNKVVPEGSERADLVKVNIDEQFDLAGQYKITSLPTIIAFRNGEQIGKFVGSRNQAGVEDFLKEIKA